jgi:hypothetical protein
MLMWSLLKYPTAYGLLVGRDLNFKDIVERSGMYCSGLICAQPPVGLLGYL